MAYWGYLNPTVRDRLVNYYATDRVFQDVQTTIAIAKALPDLAKRIEDIYALLAYKPTIEWYADITDEVYSLVQREPSLKDMADAIAGQIISEYFKKVTNLVGGHDNLVWYAKPETVSPVYELVKRSTDIETTVDFIVSTTPAGESRWDMLQTYLGDDWYPKVSDILGRKDQIMNLTGHTYKELIDLAGKHPDLVGLVEEKPFLDGMKSVAGAEGVSFGTVTDRMEWYANGAVVDSIGNLISKGILPTIKEKATFNKDLDILGRLNLLEAVQSRIQARFSALDFTVSYDFTDKVFYPGPFDAPTHFWFNQRFVGISGLRDWADWVRKYMSDFADVTLDKHRDKIVDAMLVFAQGVRAVLDCLIDVVSTVKSTGS